MPKVLILGGTRNLGHVTALALLDAGHEVAVLNRGVTRDELPKDIERLHASRHDRSALAAVTNNRHWDALVDTTSYNGMDAAEVVRCFQGRCSRIIAISSGQVYLVRSEVTAPFTEADYEGEVIESPAPNTADQREWAYGTGKRDMETVFLQSARADFPVVTLRMPMIASERDHYGRIQGYVARVLDGGPILIPKRESLPIRHLYATDAARAVAQLCVDARSGPQSYNISFGDSFSLTDFFTLLGGILGKNVNVRAVDAHELDSRSLLPTCSPYSGRWMSELDNARSVADLGPSGFRYAGPSEYLRTIVADYFDRWVPAGLQPPGYERRAEELALAKKIAVKGCDSS